MGKLRGETVTNATDCNRIITVSPRNFPNQVLQYGLDDHGVFIYKSVFEGEDKEAEKGIYTISKELQVVQVGDFVDIDTIKGWKDRSGLSKSQIYNIIKLLVEKDVLHRIKAGMYRLEHKIDPQTLQ